MAQCIMPTLLVQMTEESARRREAARQAAYLHLREALRELLPPDTELWVLADSCRFVSVPLGRLASWR